MYTMQYLLKVNGLTVKWICMKHIFILTGALSDNYVRYSFIPFNMLCLWFKLSVHFVTVWFISARNDRERVFLYWRYLILILFVIKYLGVLEIVQNLRQGQYTRDDLKMFKLIILHFFHVQLYSQCIHLRKPFANNKTVKKVPQFSEAQSTGFLGFL